MLTTRIDGTTITSLIKAAWWNEYLALLTGTMVDQPVTLASNLTMQNSLLRANGTGTTATATSGGSASVGVYNVGFTYVMADGGETLVTPAAGLSVTTTSSNKSITWAGITAGPTGTTKRNIYRSKVGTSTPLYLVGTINDNTSTTFTDTLADASLVTAHSGHSSFGGTVIFKSASGQINLTLYPDGTFAGIGGTTSFGTTIVNGNLTVSGEVFTAGRLSRTTAGDIIDATTAANTFIKAATAINFQVPNGTTIGSINSAGLTLGSKGLTCGALTATGSVNIQGGVLNFSSGTTITAANLTFSGTGSLFANSLTVNGTLFVSPTNTSTPSTVVCGTGGFGIKDNSGVKMFEIKPSGVTVIHGTQYTSTAGSATVAGGGTFDAFDSAETYVVDQEYVAGTVVCPADTTTEVPYLAEYTRDQPLVTQCTHDACPVGTIIVTVPGNCLGIPNVPSLDWYDPTLPLSQSTALNGRIFAKSAYDITPKSYVCSDGRGGIRAIAVGESAQALGITIGPVVAGMVPIMVRPTFVVL